MSAMTIPNDVAVITTNHVDDLFFCAAMTHAPAATHANIGINFRFSVYHADSTVGANLFATTAAIAVIQIEIRKNGGFFRHPFFTGPIADIRELINAATFEIINGSIAFAIHEFVHAFDAIFQYAYATAVYQAS